MICPEILVEVTGSGPCLSGHRQADWDVGAIAVGIIGSWKTTNSGNYVFHTSIQGLTICFPSLG